ncbi:DUF2290 domain-containing protein [Vibrio cholerae]
MSVLIKQDIDGLISELINKGICDDQNFSAVKSTGKAVEITFSGSEHISFALGNIEYAKIYSELNEKRSFNLKLIDGALVQMMYLVDRNDNLIQHRLAFYPSPTLLSFQDDPESYLRDELYIDIIQRKIVPFPLRFDFDARPDVHRDVVHPISHLTLGDVKDCRIPVSAALTPRWFIEFILRNFYQTSDYDFIAGLPQHRKELQLPSCITQNERNLVHVVIPYSHTH